MSDEKLLDCVNPFKSTYGVDYVKKEIELPKLKAWIDFLKKKNINFSDPITQMYPIKGSFRDYLTMTEPATEDEEHVNVFKQKAIEKYSGVKHFFKGEEIDLHQIELEKYETGRSEYSNAYSDLEMEIEFRRIQESKKVRLPDDTFIPITTQTSSYRMPSSISPDVYKELARPVQIPNNLVPNPKVREILKIKTGSTEYFDYIDKLGLEIIEKQLLGTVERL